MENFKQVNPQNKDFYNDFYIFSIKSKPLPNSSFKSFKLLNKEIKNWFDFLCKDSIIYEVSNSELKLYIFVKNAPDNVHLPFLFFISNKEHYEHALTRSKAFRECYSLFIQVLFYISNKFDKKNIIAEVIRTHKPKAMISVLNRYDKIGKVEYNKKNTIIIWTHERLNQNSRNE